MTIYTLPGRLVTYDDQSGAVTAVEDTVLRTEIQDGVETLSYRIVTPAAGGGVPDVEFNDAENILSTTVDGLDVMGNGFYEYPTVFELDGPNTLTNILLFYRQTTNQAYMFEIGGDPVLATATPTNFPVGQDWAYRQARDFGGYGPNQDVRIADIPNIQIESAPVDLSQPNDLTGTQNADEMFGGAGDDTLSGQGGNDTLYGGPDNDTLVGGEGADLLGGGTGNDSLQGGAGNDQLWSAAGDDTVMGGDGADTLGGAIGNDSLSGENGADEIWGAAGDDTLSGGAGNDTLGGSTGNDSLDGGDGADELWGASGDDTLFGGEGADTLGGAIGNDSLDGGGDADEIWGAAGMDTIQGGAGDDQIGAGTEDDLASGGSGNDTLSGGLGNDTLRGDEGNDLIFAAAGDDEIEGGAGNDTMFGGSGADRFKFGVDHGSDEISGFSSAQGDVIDLSDTSIEFADLTITAEGDNTRVTSTEGDILLNNVAASSVTADMFFFESDKTQTDNSGDDGKVETTSTGIELSIQSNQGGDLIGMDQFRADQTFGNYDGTGYTVVVLDTGIDLNHSAFGPDNNGDGISDRILYSEDFSADRDGTADDVQGHGTNVSSIIASSDPRFLGIAPDVNIIALQALGNNGSGSIQGIENALQWVVDNASTYNIVAVNMSLGPSDNVNSSARNRFMGDELEAIHDAGIITTVAVGNDYYNFQRPGMSSIAADPSVIPVGAVWSGDFGGPFNWGSGAKDFTTGAGRLTSFSQRTDDIDMVFAPGALISGARPGGGFSSMGGTSQATPMVAGMAALAQEIADDQLGRRLTPDEFHRLLIETSVTIRDGDDENDNVRNISGNLERVDMLALARAIRDLDGGTPPPTTPTDDFAADTSTTGSVAIGGTRNGNIETGGDQDWFRTSLTAGDTYTMTVNGNTLADPRMALLDANGRVLATNDDANGDDAQIVYTVQTSGTYYISAQGFGTETGTYTVGLQRNAATVTDDFAGDTSTTSTVTPNSGAATGTIEVEGDLDWHRVTLEAGGEYVIDLVGTGNNSLSDPLLRVHDSNGNEIAFNDDGGDGRNSQLLFTAETSGDYFLSAGAYNNASTGAYAVSITGGPSQDVGTDVPNDSSTTATLEVGGTYDGVLDTVGDRDWIRVSLEGGAVYDLTLSGIGATPVRDTYLRVLDSSGTVVAFDDDGGPGLYSQIDSLSVNATGTYFVSAGAYGDRGEGDYRVTLNELSGGTNDQPANDTTTSTVAVGGSVSANLSFEGDRDWHRVVLDRGESYRISLDGSGDSPLSDPYLRVYDGQSRLVTLDDDGGPGLNSELILTASTSGTFFLSAAGFADGRTGQYTLAVESLGQSDDFAGDSSTTGVAARNGSVTGDIETAGDRDWFAFDVQAGGVYEFLLEGSPTSQGTLRDSTLHVRDEFGTSLGYNDDGGTGLNSTMLFSAQTTGTVYLDAGGFGSNQGTYRLTANVISDGNDDHGDDPASASTLAVGASAMGEIEDGGDIDMFAVQLVRGATYSFGVQAAPSGNGTLSDPTLAVLDSNGNSVAYNDDGGPGLESLITGFTATSTGTYYLQAEAFSRFATGTYNVFATQTSGPGNGGNDIGDTVDTAAQAAVGRSYSSAIDEPGDIDVFALQLVAGEDYAFDLNGQGSGEGTLFDSFLTVFTVVNGEAILVALDDDNGPGRDSSVEFTADSTGTHYVVASAYNDVYDGTYQLDLFLA